MKKLSALLLVSVMLLSLWACSSAQPETEPSPSPTIILAMPNYAKELDLTAYIEENAPEGLLEKVSADVTDSGVRLTLCLRYMNAIDFSSEAAALVAVAKDAIKAVDAGDLKNITIFSLYAEKNMLVSWDSDDGETGVYVNGVGNEIIYATGSLEEIAKYDSELIEQFEDGSYTYLPYSHK